jgi:DNA end-binding protein Ku
VMRFADELVDETQLSFPAAKEIRKPELDMAKALINSLAAEWDPSKYTDEYRANLMRIIEGKMKGKDVHLEAAEEPRQAEVVDLMERLRRSLEQSGAHPSRKRAAAKSRSATTSTRKRARKARAA